MWISIFKNGAHTDSNGRITTWTNDDLDEKLVRRYNEQSESERHVAPVVNGHPASNAPAYGWVDALKRIGNIVYAKISDVAPEFMEAWKSGKIKKRSISIYPDGLLRHVGFVPIPAIKGLPDFQFSDREHSEIDVEESLGIVSGLIEEVSSFFDASSSTSSAQFNDRKKKEHRMNKPTYEELEAKNRELESLIASRDEAEKERVRTERKSEFRAFAESIKLPSERIESEISTMLLFQDNGMTQELSNYQEYLKSKSLAHLTEEQAKNSRPKNQSPGFDGMNIAEERKHLDDQVRSYMENHQGITYAEALQTIINNSEYE